MPHNIAIFASGSGSNAEKIMSYFQDSKDIQVKMLLANTPKAYALERAKKFNVPTRVFNKQEFALSDTIINELKSNNIDWIILAGFLWLIPENLVKAFHKRIVNIHPALLPLYGGKGMYGHFVHEAVHAAKDKCSGITIHMVDEKYDEGEIIFQAKCDLTEEDTPETIARKVQELEHKHFPEVIAELIRKSGKNI